MAADRSSHSGQSESKLTMVAFFVFGFVDQGLFSAAGVSAAEDLLAGETVPTSVVLICLTSPYFAMTLLLPAFIHRLPKFVVVPLQFSGFVCGLLLMALSDALAWKLTGVCFVSSACALGDVCFLSWTSCYAAKSVLRAFVAGSGTGIWLASVCYTAISTWLCVAPTTTVLTFLVLPPLNPIFFWFIEKKDTAMGSVDETTSFSGVSYTPLPQESGIGQQQDLTWREKLQEVRENALLLSSVSIGYFCEYLCIQSIVTTLAFPSAPFDPRDHYQYYVFTFWFGEFLGRFYELLVTACPILPAYTRHTWIFACVILVDTLFLFFTAWFRFVNTIWIVLVLMFFLGLNAGALYHSTFTAAALGSSSRHVEFSRAFLNIGVGMGMVIASLLGLVTEQRLKEHCMEISDGNYCITRAMNWTAHKCLEHA